MTYQTNPFAPVGLGVQSGAPMGYVDFPGIYPYIVSLTALQALTAAALPIDTASDFLLRGIVIGNSTGSFTFRYADSSRYYTSDSQISSAAFSLSASDPFPVVPQLVYPAGGQIVIDITDTSNATNAVEIWFIGTKRYLVPSA